MYLKALEIQGFKSFPDKTVLSFGEDITAIVGPNGSGKSNLSDAIRWVMGEQSTRALRGGKMEDVIFGGTAKRRQTGYAEVSLVLDNTSHIISMEEPEVMVTRRYYRSGESEYYINRRSVRLRDVNELFMDTGLGREGYSIIGQGKIDEILSVKSSDRREIFEEAAGISRYRHRKEEAENKLKRTGENLVRVNDKISELELQVAPLREQSEKAKKFLLLRDELKGLEIAVWLDSLERLRTGRIKLEADFAEAQRQREQAREELESLYAKVEEISSQMRGKDVEGETLRAQGRARQERAGELESAVAVLRTNVQNNEDNARRIQKELEQREGREGGILAQIEQRRARLEEISARVKELDAAMAEQDRRAGEIQRSAGALARELEQLRARQEIETADASEARALLSALSAAAQEVLDRDDAVRQDLRDLAGLLEKARGEAQNAAAQLRHAEQERAAAENVIGGYRLRVQTREKKAAQARERQTRLRMDESALSSRINLLTEMEKAREGYSKAVKLVMSEAQRGGLRGIYGPVADLVKVPDAYTVAIETALGGAMQNLVVEREEDGKAVIQFLKRREGGRATILPLSSIRPGRLSERQALESEPGFVGVADALVRFDPKYANVFSNLLGRVAVMENLDRAIPTARKFGYRFRIVTLDGQVLNPGGSMTGGSASRSAGILSRANELERLGGQLEALRAQLAEAGREAEESAREAAAAAYELETAQGHLREWEDAILKARGECTRCDSVVETLEARSGEMRAELETLARRGERIERDTKAARGRVESLEGTVSALKAEAEGKLTSQNTLRERLEQQSAARAKFGEELAALEAERTSGEERLTELETLRREMRGERDQSRILMADFEEKNRAYATEIEEKEEKLRALQAEQEAENARLQRLSEEKLELEARRNRFDRDSRDKNNELLNMEREVSVLEQKKSEATMEEKQILDKLWDSYELSHEAARQQRAEIESVQKAGHRIAELKRAISRLGSINVGSIEEFERVNERYTYLTDQRDDVEKAKRELEEIIAGITGEMKTIFESQFQIINSAFSQTFLELFGGGRATLELEDPADILNCGIEIRVQPPGKALKIITLLSGGEKAFVAIALYFAILKVRPTPFVVMDEIEAALDDNNVARFAQYMRRMTDNTQFIVITHRRGTMEEADVLYGVTMQEQGISRVLTINLNDAERELNLK